MQERFQTKIKLTNNEIVDGDAASRVKDDSALIDGGEVKGVEEPGDFQERKHRAYTASKLGITLVWMLGLSFLVNLVGKIILELNGMPVAAKELSDDFKTWLPVIASLVAAAVAYYFSVGKEK